MLGKQRALALTIALAVVMGAGNSARAAYMYEVVLDPGSQVIEVSPQTSLRFIPQTGRNFIVDDVPTLNNLPLAQIIFEKTSVGLETIDVPYTMHLRITNPQESANVGTFTITGRVFGTADLRPSGARRLDLRNTFESLSPLSQNIGGADFSFDADLNRALSFAGPGFGPGLTGQFTAQISVVPEPASILIMGVGCVGLACMYRRHRRRVAAASDEPVAA